MSKALIFTDLHLHNHKDRVNRLDDCLEVLNWVFAQAKERKCKNIFFLGDLFHERNKIDVLNYLKTHETLMKHMVEDDYAVSLYLLVGNHDMYHKERWDVNSIKPFSSIPNVNIIDSPTSINIDGRRIDWLPFTDNPIKELAKLKSSNGGVGGDILLGHCAVNGAILNSVYGTKSDVIVEYDNDMVPVGVEVFDDWGMTFLGHYHGAQKLNDKVEYVGSPLQLNFGEAFQEKHIVVLDLETLDKKYIVNNFSPKHLMVTPEDIQNEAYDLTNNFVRVVVSDMGSQDLIDLKRQISTDYKVLSVDLKQRDKKTQDEDSTIVEDARAILCDTSELLLTWIKERGVPDGLDEKRLILIGKTCLENKI